MNHRALLTASLASCPALAFALGLAMGTASGAIHLVAGAGQLAGATTRATTRPGHSGDAYVTAFAKAGDAVRFHFPADGLYDVHVRYSSPGGRKSAQLQTNGFTTDVMLPATEEDWATIDAGRVELHAAENDLSIGGGWGHYDIDAIDLVPASVAPVTRPSELLCDPLATPSARRLMQRLVASYGTQVLAGGYGAIEEAYVAAHTAGRRPAVYGADLMEFSPTRIAHGADPAGVVDDVLQHAKAGQAITLSWHWNAPARLLDVMAVGPGGHSIDRRWYKGFNADASTFSLAAALGTPSSDEFRLLLHDIDAIAVPLKELDAAGVPVLWRPLHEADGQWFWWGASGPGPFVTLWRLMHDRLTRVHGLHNLIWVYSYTNQVEPRWYPGDGFVDVVGMDGYPTDNRDALGRSWLDGVRLAPNKLMALTEFGGVPDVDRMHRLGYPWAYFVSWHEPNGPAKTGAAEVQRRYAQFHVGDLTRWEKTQ